MARPKLSNSGPCSLGAGRVLRPHTCREGLPHVRVTCHLVTPTLGRFPPGLLRMLQGKQRSANRGNVLINQGPHGDESVSNASHFLPRILPPTTKLGKTLKAARSASTGFTGSAERQARGKALPPGEESDATGPRVRMRAGSLAASGSSPPGPQSSPEASRKPVLSQTTAPSLEGKALVQISKQQICALSFYNAMVRNCFASGL